MIRLLAASVILALAIAIDTSAQTADEPSTPAEAPATLPEERMLDAMRVSENPGETSEERVEIDPDDDVWVRFDRDIDGRIVRMWGRDADGRFWEFDRRATRTPPAESSPEDAGLR